MIKTLLYAFSSPMISRVWGIIVKMKYPKFIIKKIIKFYAGVYNINMDEYEGNYDDYTSLSSFFVRQLDPACRPLSRDDNNVVSPADGILSSFDTIYSNETFQIKGKVYSVSELLKKDIDFSKGWHIVTIYLAPSNYHRFHYPFGGELQQYYYTRGRLFPVNQLGLTNIESLFIKNERVITQLKRGNMQCYVVAVGAALVGNIKMEYVHKTEAREKWHYLNGQVEQLEEMGRFEMGSTIILVIPKEMGVPLQQKEGLPVKVGEAIIALK